MSLKFLSASILAIGLAACAPSGAVQGTTGDKTLAQPETIVENSADLRSQWCNGGGDPFCDKRLAALADIDAEACAASGGKIEPRGRARVPVCRIYYSDAGEACQSSTDCEGECVMPGGTDDPSKAVCSTKSHPDGCITRVETGEVSQSVCID